MGVAFKMVSTNLSLSYSMFKPLRSFPARRYFFFFLGILVLMTVLLFMDFTLLGPDSVSPVDKQRGIHLFDLWEDTTDLAVLHQHHFEWLTFVPFAYQDTYNTPSLRFRRRGGQEEQEKYLDRWRDLKRLTDRYDFKIMLKPHIWMSPHSSDGKWRADIQMETEADWELWFEQYTDWGLSYAKLAEELKIALFCVGTEIHQTVVQQPERWRELIRAVRQVYTGELTYAANWYHEIEEIAFWEELDYIGVQGYFPLTQRENPTLSELERGWQPHIKYLAEQHRRFKKPVLFTELGYKSCPEAGIAPWEWNEHGAHPPHKISLRTQARCYQAYFNTVWQEPWLAGVHLWEWQADADSTGNDPHFNLKGKLALGVVAAGFGG